MKKKDIYVTNKPLSEAREQWNQALQKIDFYDRDAVETIRVDDSIGRLTAEPVVALQSSPPYNGAVWNVRINSAANGSHGLYREASMNLRF